MVSGTRQVLEGGRNQKHGIIKEKDEAKRVIVLLSEKGEKINKILISSFPAEHQHLVQSPLHGVKYKLAKKVLRLQCR